jgi:hypothetical protein
MSSEAPATPYRRGLAFTAGVGFAALPAIGPFVALLALTTGRVELQRADRWWWTAAVLMAAPYVVTGWPLEAARELLQVLAVWLIYRSATAVRQSLRGTTAPADLGIGLVVGLAFAVALGLRQLAPLRWDTALTALDLIAWQAQPTLFAHSILVLAALLGIAVPSARLAVVALALGAIALVVAGANEGVLAWLLVAIGLQLVGRRGDRVARGAGWALIVVIAVIASGLGAQVGIGRPGFLTAVTDRERQVNLFRGTEFLAGDWWNALGVRAATSQVTVDGTPRTGFLVTKASSDSWARLQQVVTIQPDITYNLSAAWRAEVGQRPGLDGWGRAAGAEAATVLSTTVHGDTVRSDVSPDIEVLGTSLTRLPDGFERGSVTFRFLGSAPLAWYTGVVVDRSARTDVSLTVSEIQLAEGPLRPYEPGLPDRGVNDLRSSRLPIWTDALAALAARPFFGWGPDGLPRAVSELRPEEVRVRPLPVHGHNLVLAVGAERGLMGIAGVLTLAALLALRVVQQRDRNAAVVLAGVVVLNFFDATLLSGGVIYPLAAVLGWRAVGHGTAAESETGLGSALAVRIGLAIADTLAAAAALTVAGLLVGWVDPTVTLDRVWSASTAYLILLWPLAASMLSLYPGYGLARQTELARTVRAAGAAGALFGFVVLVFGSTFSMPPSVVIAMIGIATVSAPFTRAAGKAVARWLGLWGRPVVVLGNDETSADVVEHLLRNPSIGLVPVATFGPAEGPRVGRSRP